MLFHIPALALALRCHIFCNILSALYKKRSTAAVRLLWISRFYLSKKRDQGDFERDEVVALRGRHTPCYRPFQNSLFVPSNLSSGLQLSSPLRPILRKNPKDSPLTFSPKFTPKSLARRRLGNKKRDPWQCLTAMALSFFISLKRDAGDILRGTLGSFCEGQRQGDPEQFVHFGQL